MGFSVLSLIEIIYFFTLRVLCKFNCRRNKIIEGKMNSVAIGDGKNKVPSSDEEKVCN